MKTIVARIRERKLIPKINECERLYRSDIADIQSYQLDKFNTLWAEIQRNVPCYQLLVQSGSVPTEIKCWEDFAKFPILSRISIQEDVTKFIDHSQKIIGWSVTGGSTGEPFRIPYGALESQLLGYNAWLGRRFYDIRISDRLFHLWGHSHIFGSGWQRYVKQANRKIKDWLLGYQKFSAYHLTPLRLRQAGKAIIKMRPDYIIGYSRSLTLLARENADLAHIFHQLRIKVIIATTEAFNQPSDAKFIEQIFGCPVGMEYGAAETGVIAYTDPSIQQYKTFWDTYLIEAIPVTHGEAKLLLTALYPRNMPLIRYDIGDNVRQYERVGNSIIKFDMILGRDNDLIDTGGGGYVHPVALIHCIQSQQGVLGVQIIQEKDKSVTINILSEEPLQMRAETSIRRNLATLDSKLSVCKINYVKQLEQTLAGKTKWVIRR